MIFYKKENPSILEGFISFWKGGILMSGNIIFFQFSIKSCQTYSE